MFYVNHANKTHPFPVCLYAFNDYYSSWASASDSCITLNLIFKKLRSATVLKLLLLVFLNGFCTTHFFAQANDSINRIKKEKYLTDSTKICRPEIIRPQLGFDNRKSFIRNSPIDITGYFAGILCKRHYRFTVGYYQVENQNKKSPFLYWNRNRDFKNYLWFCI